MKCTLTVSYLFSLPNEGAYRVHTERKHQMEEKHLKGPKVELSNFFNLIP